MSEAGADGRRSCLVLMSDCGGVLDTKAADDVEKRLRMSTGEDLPVCRPRAPGVAGAVEDIRLFVDRTSANRILIAGCRAATSQLLRGRISEATGLPAAYIRHVGLYAAPGEGGATGISEHEDVAAAATRQIQRAVQAAEFIEEVETVAFPLNRDVLVLGDDECARAAAAEVSRFGFKTTMISARETAVNDTSFELVTGARVTDACGTVGAFEVAIAVGGNGSTAARSFSCGAIIDAREPDTASAIDTELSKLVPSGCEPGQIVTLESLPEKADSLPRIARERSVAILLDLRVDESKASTADACRAALSIQRTGVFQVHLLCRHARVASPEISELYDQAREAGVAIFKYDEQPRISLAESEGPALVEIRCSDPVLHAPVSLLCDIVAISCAGLASAFAELYVNNLHFSPTNSSVPGYFLAGAATGERYAPQASGEALAAALAVRKLLAPGELTLELSTASVDEEKCAICLTCIRICPHQAMRVDSEKNIAANLPQACQRCGICVGVCPARAIALPGYSEDAVMALLD